MKILPFQYHESSIRVIDRDGEPWFVAKDVALTLGYSKPENAITRHCRANITTPKQGGGVLTLIPERDVYRLVMRSKLPAAEAFEEWVVGEVLPSIRKTGGYAKPINWDDPRELAGLVQQGAQKVIELNEKIAVLEPQAKAFDRIGGLDGSICLRDAGKKLQLQRCDDIFSILERAHWIYRRTGNRQWTAFQGKIRSGYLEHKVTTRVLPDGNERIDTQVRMTAKGLAKLSKMIEAPMQEELL